LKEWEAGAPDGSAIWIHLSIREESIIYMESTQSWGELKISWNLDLPPFSGAHLQLFGGRE
jgi:hypothetical protein